MCFFGEILLRNRRLCLHYDKIYESSFYRKINFEVSSVLEGGEW